MVRKGERYRSKKSVKVTAMTSWAAPFTGGINGTLAADEEFSVLNDPPPGATAVHCDPIRYQELHAHFVAIEDRKHKKYRGYSLCIPIGAIQQRCELIQEGPVCSDARDLRQAHSY